MDIEEVRGRIGSGGRRGGGEKGGGGRIGHAVTGVVVGVRVGAAVSMYEVIVVGIGREGRGGEEEGGRVIVMVR